MHFAKFKTILEMETEEGDGEEDESRSTKEVRALSVAMLHMRCAFVLSFCV